MPCQNCRGTHQSQSPGHPALPTPSLCQQKQWHLNHPCAPWEESFYLNHLIQWFSKILSEFSSNIQQINFTSWNHDSDEGVIISASPLKRKDRITFKCELLLDTCHNKTKYKQLWYNMKATSGISNHSCITVQLYLGQYHETLTLKCGEQRAHHAECSNPWTSIKCQMLRPLISCFISGFNWECPHKLKDVSSKLTQ